MNFSGFSLWFTGIETTKGCVEDEATQGDGFGVTDGLSVGTMFMFLTISENKPIIRTKLITNIYIINKHYNTKAN